MKLDKEKIEEYLKSSNIDIYVYDEIDSTNLQSERFIKDGKDDIFAVIADSQTAGMGRQGKSFYSPSETGVYLTVAVKPEIELNEAVTLTSAAAVAVAHVLKKSGAEPRIKWVNDIYINDKKVCGILAKAVKSLDGELWVIIGIGVNVTTENFPEELRSSAASIGIEIDRSLLAAEIISSVLNITENLSDRSYMDEYRKMSNVIGREIVFIRNGEKTPAKAVGIDDNGGLIVDTGNGTEILTSGEITLRFN
ncbi:MAG: biotin--[acetyl-CoA-carboxylase] ligase [Clostridia bacterium]|nr:biotin--[acetyl-CoA-carboxylase] ligase [Clostridia bacterium]